MAEMLMYTKENCPYCRKAKTLLKEKGREFVEIDVARDSKQLQEMLAKSRGRKTVPEIFIDGELIGGYDELATLNRQGKLDEILGLKKEEKERKAKLVILGSGPAGLTAALYASRAALQPVLVAGKDLGGQLFTTTQVENYPGFPDGVLGPELMERMLEQALRFGMECIPAAAEAVDLSHRPFTVRLSNDSRLLADALIIATGASPRELGVRGERELRGYGVSTCATCDGPFFRDAYVLVVGGGDSALEEALFVSKFARQVSVVHRRDRLRASKAMQEKAFRQEKLDFFWNTAVREIYGDKEQGVTGVHLVNTKTREEHAVECQGVFIAIGHEPNTALFRGQLEMDEKGFIVSREFPKTSVPGAFVAGDVYDFQFKQAVTAAGDGCKAALAAERFLEEG